MTNEMALWLALGSALVAVVYGLLTTKWVLGKPAGSEKRPNATKPGVAKGISSA